MNTFFQILSFMFLFGLMLFLVYVTTRFIGKKAAGTLKGKYLNVVDSINLGLNKQILLIKAGDRFVLVSSTQKGIEFLTDVQVNENELEKGVKEEKSTPFDFKSFFEKYLQGYKEKKHTQQNSGTVFEEFDGKPGVQAFRKNLNRLRNITDFSGQVGKDGDENH